MSIPVKISGSRSSAILGLSPYQTQVEVWLNIKEEIEPGFCKRRGYAIPEFKSNASIIWGSSFEDEIINIVEEIKNIKIKDREKLHIKHDFISCHPDGLTPDILIENKTTSEFYFRDNFGDEYTDKIPVNYQIQIQHNLFCCDRKECLMPVLVFPKRPDDYESAGIDINKIDKKKWIEVLNDMGCLKFYQITAHPEAQKLMIEHYTEFWNKNILEGIEPEPRTYDDIKLLFPDPIGTVVASEEIEWLVMEYKNIKEEISNSGRLGQRADYLKTKIMDYARKQSGVLDDDTRDKTIIKGQDGKKLMTYGKNKNGVLFLR